jgi:peptidyl-prolyl cis-trans isomerase C
MKQSYKQAGLIALPIVLLAAIAACSHDTGVTSVSGGNSTIQLADAGPTVETVNGEAVPQRLLDALARTRNLDISKPEMRDRALKELANYVVAAQAARDEKFLKDPDFAAQAEVLRLQALSAATVAEFQKRAKVDDAVLHAEYDKMAARTGGSEYDFSQIVFRSQLEAAKAAGEIAAGKTFDKVSEAHKKDALQTRSLTRVRAGLLPESLAKALAAMKPGETDKVPLQTPLGWLVVRLDAVTPHAPPAFDDVKEGLSRSALKRSGEERIMKLRADAKVSLAEPAPSPPYAAAKPDAAAGKPAPVDAAKPKN